MEHLQIKELASRCAKKIEEKLGWKNLLGAVEKNLLEILPIILEEIKNKEE